MSEHELPEDVTRWPADPFALLGVRADDDARAVKRAYTRLIRRFKPEHHPEQFQRIRAAYDQARILAERRAAHARPADDEDELFFDPPGTAAFTDGEPSGRRASQGDDGSSGEGRGESRPRPSGGRAGDDLDEAIDRAWTVAKSGDLSGAYASLRSLAERHYGHAALCVRLHWLLRLDSSLDGERSPIDWVVAGLRTSGLRGPLFELYRRALSTQPKETLAADTGDLLDAPGPCERLVQLVAERIAAAGWILRHDLVLADLDRVRDRVVDESPAEWVRLLGAALDQLSWSDEEPVVLRRQELAEELDSFVDLHLTVGHVFDRRELLEEIVHAVDHEPGLGELAVLARDAWTRPQEKLWPKLALRLQSWSRDPAAALSSLDRLPRTCRPVIEQIRQLIEHHTRFPFWREPDGAVAETLARLVEEWAGYEYGVVRLESLAFCLNEAVTPGDMVQVAAGLDAPRVARVEELSELALRLHDDAALQTVVAGVQAFQEAATS